MCDSRSAPATPTTPLPTPRSIGCQTRKTQPVRPTSPPAPTTRPETGDGSPNVLPPACDNQRSSNFVKINLDGVFVGTGTAMLAATDERRNALMVSVGQEFSNPRSGDRFVWRATIE